MLLPLIISGSLIGFPTGKENLLDYVRQYNPAIENVYYTNNLPKGFDGYVPYRDPLTIIFRDTAKAYLDPNLVFHEIYHTIAFSKDCLRTYLGKAPFITSYAKMNNNEDGAEMYSAIMTGQKLQSKFYKKIATIHKCLEK